MILLKHHQKVCIRMDLDLAGCVRCLEYALCELLTKAFNLQDAQSVLTDGHETFRTLRRAEWTGALQRLVADRRHSVLAHIAVAQPRLVRESDHGILALLTDLCQCDPAGAEELLAAISHDSGHIIDKLSHKDTIVEAHV